MRGYDPDEVKNFLDQVIKKVEQINSENKKKDSIIKEQEIKIIELSKLEEENQKLRQKIALYDNGEEEFISSIKELEKKLTFKEKKYSNIDDAVNSLINEETKGLFLNSSLMDIYLEDHHIENQIRSIESIDLKIKTESELKEVNVTKNMNLELGKRNIADHY